jgi:hypothetical protein
MQGTSSTPNTDGSNQGTPMLKSETLNVYMMNSYLNLQTRARDYGNPEFAKKDEFPKLSSSLHIDELEVYPMSRIPKGVLKRTSHKPNARGAQIILLFNIWPKRLVPCPH